MPAYFVIKSDSLENITSDLYTFSSSITEATTIRNAAWALLDPDDPVIGLKPAWDTWKASVLVAFIAFQEIRTSSQQRLFDYYNNYMESMTRYIEG